MCKSDLKTDNCLGNVIVSSLKVQDNNNKFFFSSNVSLTVKIISYHKTQVFLSPIKLFIYIALLHFILLNKLFLFYKLKGQEAFPFYC